MAFLLALAPLPGRGSAQTPALLRGHVLDLQTLAPVGGAFVALRGAGRGVLSDSTGYFALPVAPAERYALQARQLGYRELSVAVSSEAAESPLVLRLDPDPVQLQGLTVLAERFRDRRRGPFGVVEVLTGEDLLHAPDGAASDLVRRIVPFARPCNADTDSLCVNMQGRIEPLMVCVDERRVVDAEVELEHLDPRGLYMVEVFRRGGQVRLYSRGYVSRLLASGAELPPLSFGCGGVGVPSPWGSSAP